MTFPKNRSNSVRMLKVRTSKGMKLHFSRRPSGNAHYCALCGARMAGTSSAPSIASSTRTPERKYGGHLCHACAKGVIKTSTRLSQGTITLEEVDIQMRKYVLVKKTAKPKKPRQRKVPEAKK